MSYEEFTNLSKNDTVEDKDGVLGRVTDIDLNSHEVWVLWEDEKEPLWSNYREVNIY